MTGPLTLLPAVALVAVAVVVGQSNPREGER